MNKAKTSLLGIMFLFFLIGQIICPSSALGADEFGLDSPNGGEILKVGTTQTIKWHLNNPMVLSLAQMMGGKPFYRLEYSTDSGATYKLIQDLSDFNSTSFSWTIPNSTTSKGRVKVTLFSKVQIPLTPQYQTNTVATDLSDNDFSISNSIIPILPKPPLIVLTAPAGPSDLEVKAISANKIVLTWKDNSTNEAQFILERSSGNSSNFVVLATLDADSKDYTDNSVSAATKYYYRVKATNLGGSSVYSNQDSATTPSITTPPLPPVQPPLPPVTQQTMIKFYLGSTDFLVNEQLQTMDASPVSIDGRTLLPIKYVAQPLGASTAWEPSTQKVTVTLGSKVIELWVGNNTAKVNGQEKLIDPNNTSVKPLILPPGRTMLPLRFIGENLGCQVDWNPTLNEAKLTYSK